MRSDVIVVDTPVFDHHLGFDPVPEPLHGQAFVAELAVEAFVRAVLPRLAGIDQRRLDTFFAGPFEQRRTDEFRAIVNAEWLSAIRGDELAENLDDALGTD